MKLYIFLMLGLCFSIITIYSLPKFFNQQLLLHHATTPSNEQEQQRWSLHIRDAVDALNSYLVGNGYLNGAPEYAAKYPHKKNRAFFSRSDDTFGIYTLYIPDGVDKEVCEKFLRSYFKENNIPIEIDDDHVVPLSIPEGPSKLNGFGLTFDELEALRAGTFKSQLQNQIDSLKNKQKPTADQSSALAALQQKLPIIDQAETQLFWHQTIPTTGLRKSETWYPPKYPFVPHFFSLWQLAPGQGAGISVADIDTGVAGFEFQGPEKILKHRDLFMPLKSGHTYNIVSENGLDPVDQLAEVVAPYLDPKKFSFSDLEDQIPLWVFEHHQQGGKTTGLEAYLKKYGLPDVVQSDGTLSEKGKQAITDFTTGDFGIVAKKNFFTIGNLKAPTTKQAIKELLPLTPIAPAQPLAGFLSHGSHTFGLIAAQLDEQATLETDKGIVGIAPKANVMMIKAFRNDTMASDKSTLIAALKKAIRYNVDVVNMSLKIGDVLDLTTSSTKLFRRIVCHIPYVVAASGNNGDPNFPNYVGKTVGYPSRFPMVPFSVGAFGYEDNTPYIASFSQYEPNVGPKFVAPGVGILSAGLLPNQTVDSAYLFLDGTSMATPIMTGFVALMLGEFKQDFTRTQLIETCYRSAVKLADTKDWQEKVILGALDMRTALFTLHILKSIKAANIVKDFDGEFQKLLLSVHALLFDPCAIFGNQYLKGISFQDNMMTYIDVAQKAAYPLDSFYIPAGDTQQDITDAVNYYVTVMRYLLGGQKGTKPSQLSDATLKKVADILKQETVDLFPDVNAEAKKVLEVFYTGHPYWQKKAEQLRAEIAQKD